MIKCLVCNKEFKKILSSHLRKHDITKEEYLKQYPNALLVDEETRKKYSESNSKYLASLTKEEKKARTYIRTEEIKQKNRDSVSKYFKNNPSYLERYTTERNEKISNAKTKWWESIDTDTRSELLKQTQKVFKDRVGVDVYNNIKRVNGAKSKEKFDSQNNIIHSSKFELEMYKFLSDNNISYIPQFNVNGWIFDCYIPDKNLLLEFDGDFWHPLSIEECKYEFQKKRIHTDKFKTNIAISSGYNLQRIRLSEKHKIKTII